MAAPRRIVSRVFSPGHQLLTANSRRHAPPVAPARIRHASGRYSGPARRASTANATATLDGPIFDSPRSAAPVAAEPSATGPFMDPQTARRSYQQKRQNQIRRMWFSGIGLVLSLACLGLVIYNIDIDELNKKGAEKRKAAEERKAAQEKQGYSMDASAEANEKFQGKDLQVIGAGEGKRIVAHGQGGEEIELVETGTSSVPHFPRTIYLPSAESRSTTPAQPNTVQNPGTANNQEEYTLVGLGIRTVSFLSIQVYVVGMYVRTQDISSLQTQLIHIINESASTLIPSEKDELKRRLLDPEKSREIWQTLLRVPGIKTAWRISPTRNTDFGHLRDGWITGIQNRIREARATSPAPSGELEYDSEAFGSSVQTFKSIFAGGKAPKGSVMLLTRDEPGNLDVWFQDRVGSSGEQKDMQHLGSVSDERIARLIWLGYLGGAKVSSEAARTGVADGCVEFAGRPVGSVETMVH